MSRSTCLRSIDDSSVFSTEFLLNFRECQFELQLQLNRSEILIVSFIFKLAEIIHHWHNEDTNIDIISIDRLYS